MVTTLNHTARELGFAAQIRAADPAFSAWVSANAGTGKTRVLTDRVARLLLAGTDPQRLLCLTFTRAAAAEMQERLFARLGRWATAPEDALRADIESLGADLTADSVVAARRLFARALEIPGGLKIQTIHAFCEGLLKRFPVEAGIAAHFSVLDEGQAAELLAMARTRVLHAARGQSAQGAAGALGAALTFVADIADERDFQALIAELIAQRNRLDRLRRRHGGIAPLIAATRAHLGVEPDISAAAVLAEVELAPRADLRRAAAVLVQGGATDRRQAARLATFLDATDRTAALAAYRECLLTRAGASRRTLASLAAQRIDPGVEAVLRAEQARVGAVLDRYRAALVAQATEAALRLGDALLDAYADEKRRRAVLDYDDLVLETRRLLRERADSTWILSKLDSGIDHVLIDEAQDTSPEQWEVVQALTEEFFAGEGARPGARTMFAVGDEKQSIYGFQGADPHAFRRMRGYFADRVRAARCDWRQEELALSFRSTTEILKTVDLVFAQPEARAGLGADAAAIRHTAFRAGHEGLVEIWPTIRPDARTAADPWAIAPDAPGTEEPPAKLARRIAATIDGWLRDRVPLVPRGRPVRPGDVLILVRRRNAFVTEMVRALKQRRIPVAGADRLVLTDQMAVKDLIALGRCVLLPDDDLALATALRGPLLGVTEDALFDLAHGRPGSLWQALEQAAGAGVSAAEAAFRFLAAARTLAARRSPFDFYTDLLGPLAGRRGLLARLGLEANDPIDSFLDAALRFERLEPPSLEAFLHWIEAAAPEERHDHGPGRDEVRVMTVHGAKGLEANIVFLADTCAVPTARHDPRLIAAGAEDGLLLWPVRAANDTPESARGRAAARRAREEEYRRLLYVAMTRARDRLYVCGYETGRPLPADCWYALIGRALKPACAEFVLPTGETGWRLQGRQRVASEGEAALPAQRLGPAGLPGWARRAAPQF